LKSANLALRFFLELAALVALGYWGATVQGPIWLRVVLAIAAPALMALVWGMLIAPRARFAIAERWRIVLALLIFATATAALIARGDVALAATFAALAAVNAGLLILWQQSSVRKL
jgi:hypothetical protein